MIKEISIRVRQPSTQGIFHDSREDCRRLGEVCNTLIDKANELVDRVNELERRLAEVEG